jgi:catechol 2,3-dioxygenase
MRLGPVHLRVADIGRSLAFYGGVLGLRAEQVSPAGVMGTVPLRAGDGAALIVLHEVPGARAKPARTTGLYHYAILVPSRADLARVEQRFGETGYPLEGASDHGVSEALYLSDPDGNGIEIYRDRPRDEWPRRGNELLMGVKALDMASLMAELRHDDRPWSGLPDGTVIGHVHLHVAQLAPAEAFYRQGLGFDLMQRFGSSATFLSAGGYHHHIGANVWAGVGAPPPPADAAGLDHFTIVLPSQSVLEHTVEHLRKSGIAVQANEATAGERSVSVLDPSGNRVELVVEA